MDIKSFVSYFFLESQKSHILDEKDVQYIVDLNKSFGLCTSHPVQEPLRQMKVRQFFCFFVTLPGNSTLTQNLLQEVTSTQRGITQLNNRNRLVLPQPEQERRVDVFTRRQCIPSMNMNYEKGEEKEPVKVPSLL